MTTYKLNASRLKKSVKLNFSRTKAFKDYFSSSPSWTKKKIDWFDAQVTRLGLDTTHWTGLRGVSKKKSFLFPTDEILIKNSPANPITVKRRVLREGLIEYKCALCTLSDKWNGSDLTLQLDHINGDKKDARLMNLRFLCPNCHSQTETWGPANRVDSNLPDIGTLLSLSKTLTNTKIASMYGVNQSSVSNKLFRYFARAV